MFGHLVQTATCRSPDPLGVKVSDKELAATPNAMTGTGVELDCAPGRCIVLQP